MASATLVEKELLQAGWYLLEELQQQQVPVTALFWAVVDEDDWRLILGTDWVESHGPLKVYAKIRQAVDRVPELKQSGLAGFDVSVVSPRANIIEEARRRYGAVGADHRVVRRVSLASGDFYVYVLQEVEQGAIRQPV